LLFSHPVIASRFLARQSRSSSYSLISETFVSPLMGAADQAGGDGIPGTHMAAGGLYAGFNFNINTNMLAPVPVPAAIWLFGSGLLGLIGVARRKARA
jgi:hypothetical protein